MMAYLTSSSSPPSLHLRLSAISDSSTSFVIHYRLSSLLPRCNHISLQTENCTAPLMTTLPPFRQRQRLNIMRNGLEGTVLPSSTLVQGEFSSGLPIDSSGRCRSTPILGIGDPAACDENRGRSAESSASRLRSPRSCVFG